jgi:hypothetical protein
MNWNDNDLHWTAGLLEGEGFFESGPQLSITCTMTDKEPIQKLKKLWGGSAKQLNTLTSKGKITYRWYCGRMSGSIELASLLHPLMSPRRQAAILGMHDRDKTQRRWKATKPGMEKFRSSQIHKTKASDIG